MVLDYMQVIETEGLDGAEVANSIVANTASSGGELLKFSFEFDAEQAYMTLVWEALADDWESDTDRAFNNLLEDDHLP